MEQIKDILPKNKWEDSRLNFINRGLGLMREEERELLLSIGAIKEAGDIDIIACDSFCVDVYRNGDATCVFEGSEFECKMEMEKIKKDKPSIDVKVRPYPKAYFDYYAKERARREAIEFEDEANKQLLNQVGF